MRGRKERRSYFRIDDVIGLSYEIIEDKTPPNVIQANEAEVAFSRALKEIDSELNRAANLVWRESPSMARALGILNKKVSLVAQYCPPQGVTAPDHYEEYPANISGSGMSFRSTEQLAKNTRLNICAILKPSNVELQFAACVVSCERVQDMPRELFLLRVQIAEEETAAKELLVQHVVQKQSYERSNEQEASGE